jgi:hypothetical protein
VKIAEFEEERTARPPDAFTETKTYAVTPRRSPSRPVSAARDSPDETIRPKLHREENKEKLVALYCCNVRRSERFSVLEPRGEEDEGEIERSSFSNEFFSFLFLRRQTL